MRKVYEYRGFHFIPYSKLGVVYSMRDIILRSDPELGFSDGDYSGIKSKYAYSHENFYKAVNDSKMDIFKCVENGKLYVPCDHELFIYEGMRVRKKDEEMGKPAGVKA